MKTSHCIKETQLKQRLKGDFKIQQENGKKKRL